jgi:hypothetical protein
METGTELTSDERAESKGRGTNRRSPVRLWVAVSIAGIVILGVWVKYSPGASRSLAGAPPAALRFEMCVSGIQHALACLMRCSR